MVHKGLLKMLLLFLGFSFLLCSAGVPTSSKGADQNMIREGDQLLFEMLEGFLDRRMDMESADYPGTGANNHHDPRSPGKA
ncbi:hypothetical protein CJ030_MR2G016452 [Morella rubra]|uniref:Uncharacterized protein n=1 Tax=Morella rubra TaxID=262757 RepID=A0A6A1WD90_9ROSI|nr:hypothetical protein CJ030_MR2G016452 [Morella rubra]